MESPFCAEWIVSLPVGRADIAFHWISFGGGHIEIFLDTQIVLNFIDPLNGLLNLSHEVLDVDVPGVGSIDRVQDLIFGLEGEDFAEIPLRFF